MEHVNARLEVCRSINMNIMRVTLLGAALAIPVMVHAQSTPGWQQSLQGLVTGNQSQDSALQQAYQRGYQRGRDDEARVARNGGDHYRSGGGLSDDSDRTTAYPGQQGYSGR
jgi:hypothetical protein